MWITIVPRIPAYFARWHSRLPISFKCSSTLLLLCSCLSSITCGMIIFSSTKKIIYTNESTKSFALLALMIATISLFLVCGIREPYQREKRHHYSHENAMGNFTHAALVASIMDDFLILNNGEPSEVVGHVTQSSFSLPNA